jgi:hypothetical protein
MEPSALRYAILRLVDAHEATGTSSYLEDKNIASALGVDLADVQRQLVIMENRGLLDLAKAMGPSYAARMTPAGMEALEAAGNSTQAASRRVIGF